MPAASRLVMTKISLLERKGMQKLPILSVLLIRMKNETSRLTSQNGRLIRAHQKEPAIARREVLIKSRLTNVMGLATSKRMKDLIKAKREVFLTDQNDHLRRDPTKKAAIVQKGVLIKSHSTNEAMIEILGCATDLTKVKKEAFPIDQNGH